MAGRLVGCAPYALGTLRAESLISFLVRSCVHCAVLPSRVLSQLARPLMVPGVLRDDAQALALWFHMLGGRYDGFDKDAREVSRALGILTAS